MHAATSSEDEMYSRLWASVVGKSEMTFTTSSCGHAVIALSELPGNTNLKTYEIELQRDPDGLTTIKDSVGGVIQVSYMFLDGLMKIYMLLYISFIPEYTVMVLIQIILLN